VVKEWIPNSSRALLEENPNYVNGPMAVKQIEIVYVADLTSRVLQLSQGTLDYVNDLPAGTATDYPREVRTFGVPIAGTMMVAVNGDKPGTPLANVNVRKAISLAIDREAVAKRAFFGVMKPVTGLIYPDIPEASNALPNGGKRDLAAAKALLATTPYASGFKMTLMTWGQRAGWTNATLVMKENLAELKIDVTVDPVDDGVAQARQAKGDYEAVFAGVSSFPLSIFLGFFGKGGIWSETWAHTSNPPLWDLIAKASVEPDPAKRLDMYRQVNQMEADDMWFIPVTDRVELHGSRVPGDVYKFVKLSQNPMVKTLKEALAGK
jgi:ABC-type transport system substrate-binding protein